MADRARQLWGPAPLLAGVAAGALAVVDPIGWDHFGPLRWLVVWAVGWWAVVAARDRAGLLGGDPTTVTWLFAGLLAWGVVPTVLAADPLHAWIGTPDRRMGWLTWLLAAGLFAAAAGLDRWERSVVVRGFAVGACGLGLYTLAELAGLGIDVDFAGSRAGGPFGQPAFLGAAAVLATPIALAVAIGDRPSDGSGPDVAPSRRWRAVGAVGAVLGSVAILASQSRAAWLGAAVAGLVWLAAWPGGWRTGGRRAGLAVGAVAAAAVLAVGDLRARISGAFGQGGVIDGRLDEWRVGLRAIGGSPLVGYGPEGYRTVFGANVDERYVIDWGREVITDRAHSGPLDLALAFGVPGAAVQIALLMVLAAAAVRAIRSGRWAAAGPGLGVVAYGVQQLFLFPLGEVDPLFWIASGLVVAREARPRDADARVTPTTAPSAWRAALGGLAVGVAVVVTVVGVLDVVANTIVGPAIEDGVDRHDRLGTARRLRPDSTRYRFIGARLAAADGDLDGAIELIDDGLELSPADPAFLGEAARLRLERARTLPDGPARTSALGEALSALEDLVADDPNHPEHLQRLGIAQALTGDLTAAEATLERAVLLAPGREEPQRNLDEVRRLLAGAGS